jgi:hypothetical protein
VLPNLIVIGAAKCGTTSLHEYLDEHPEISMSREKELHFFVDGKNWGRGLAWYESHFDSAAPVRGESSPGYSAFPLYRGVPERMAETIPEAKLIYLVRDPVQRIVSHYTHRTVNWPEMGTLEEALADPHIREWLVTPSRYWLQLEPSFRSPRFRRAHNAATGRVRRNRAGEAVSTLLVRTLGPGRSQALREHVPPALKRPFRYEVEPAELPPALRTELEEEVRGDAMRLRAHTGLAFAGWSI